MSPRVARRAARVAILDYGVGNLHSLAKGLQATGAEVRVEVGAAEAVDADLVVLPGVGAFSAAAERLAPAGAVVRDAIGQGVAALGICLGMQLLFDESEEGPGAGLGVLPGRVTRLRAHRVPHMGWNRVEPEEALMRGPDTAPGAVSRRAPGDPALLRSGLTEAYFAHGYACRPDDLSCVTAWTTIDDDRIAAVVRAGALVGTQFHPEKSGAPGLAFLRAVVDAVREGTPGRAVAGPSAGASR